MFVRKISFIFMILISSVFISGCGSVPKITGKAELCGFVIDENNKPVGDYIITAAPAHGLKKSTVTDKQGIFIFSDMALGNYVFSGGKEGYVNLENEKIKFLDSTKILCFQISSIDDALDSIERRILCDEYTEALNLLEKINIEKNTPAAEVISIYESYIKSKMNLQEEIIDEV